MKNKSTIIQLQAFFSKPYWFYATVLIFLVLGGYLLMYDMRFGPWAFSDSAEYIISAKNLVEGNGLGIHAPDGKFMPLTLHPPFYSLLLAPFIGFNLDIFMVIKWLNILFYTGSIFLLIFGIFRITRATLFALSIGLLFLISPTMISNFNGAMTEPLFIFLSIANIIFLNLYIKEKKKWWFWGAVLAASLATLTRYIGLVTIFTGFTVLVLFSETPWKKRLGISLTYSVLAIAPIILWFFYVKNISGSMGARNFEFDKGILDGFTVNRIALTGILGKWLSLRLTWFPVMKSKIPVIYSSIITSGFLLMLLLITWWKKRVAAYRYPLAFIISACLYIAGYFGLLLVSYFSSLPPDLNERMFSPLMIFFFIFMFGVLFTVIQLFKLPKALKIIPIFLVIILGISYWEQTHTNVFGRNTAKFSYSSPTWINSQLINEIQNMSGRPTIYSNHPIGILLHTGFFPYEISHLQQFKVEMNISLDLTIALFYPISDDYHKVLEDFFSLAKDQDIGLISSKEFSDGIIYQFAINQ